MKRLMQYGVCVCFCVMFLAGCGQMKEPKTADVSSLIISENGKVSSRMIGEFEETYYTADELPGMAEELQSAAAEMAESYNKEHQSGDSAPVTVVKTEALEDGTKRILVTMEYDNTEVYSDFNEKVLFYGTLEQALAKGYDLDVELVNVKKPEETASPESVSQKEKYILISNEKVRLYCPRRITYISSGVAVLEDGSVDASSAEDTVYILMK